MRLHAREERVDERRALHALHIARGLDLRRKRLLRDRLLVCGLERHRLVVERLAVVARVDLASDFVPLALRTLPFFVLLLQAAEDYGNHCRGHLLHRIPYLVPEVPSVDFLENALVDRFADATEVGLEFERRTLLGGELQSLVVQRLQDSNGAMVGFDMEVILMAYSWRSSSLRWSASS